MKKQILTLTLVMTLLCAGVSATYANEMNCKMYPCHKKIHKMKLTPEELEARRQARINKFENSLGFTDEQKAKAKQIREDSFKKSKPLIDKKMQKIKTIIEIRENDDISIKAQDKKIESVISELKVLDQEIRQVKQDERKAFKAILTEEQKEKFNQMKKKHRKFDNMPPRPFFVE